MLTFKIKGDFQIIDWLSAKAEYTSLEADQHLAAVYCWRCFVAGDKRPLRNVLWTPRRITLRPALSNALAYFKKYSTVGSFRMNDGVNAKCIVRITVRLWQKCDFHTSIRVGRLRLA